MYFLTILLSICSLCVNLSAATILVGPPPASIQDAIDSASDGDTIQLSAGTYVQEVQVISKNLDIIGAGQDVTIIQAPDSSTHLSQDFNFGNNYWCIVMVDNQAAPTSQTVNISDLTVDGNDQQDTIVPPIYGNSDRFFAIGYHNANGTVNNVHTTNTRQFVNFNELAGGGIINASDTGTVNFSVTNSLIDFYQRIGIDCRGAALTATITGNTVNRGYVLTPSTITATPNGIQFSGSTVGSITNNTISENIGTVANASGSGIIPFGAGNSLVVSNNILNNNDAAIAAISNGDGLSITDNTVNFTMTPGVNPPEGIIVQDTAGTTTVSGNIMNNIPAINMEIIASTDQPFTLMNNQFNGSDIGLQVTGNGTVGPMITMDSDSFTSSGSYYIKEVTSPHNIWPSTSTVTFDGLLSGHMTMAEFDGVLAKIYDQHNDPTLGLVLDFIPPTAPALTSLEPPSGPTSGVTEITITGSSFISSNTQVFVGGVAATNVQVVSDTEITADVPAGTGTVDVTVVTPFGTSPVTGSDQFTYVTEEPASPSHFKGRIHKVKVEHQTLYVLKAEWQASPTPDVVKYRIYKCGVRLATIPASAPLKYTRNSKYLQELRCLSVVAVDSNNVESAPVKMHIISQDTTELLWKKVAGNP